MHAYRTHTCGALRAADAGQTVRLSGWVHRKRDHGGLLFVDLRDHYGLTQCVIPLGSDVFAAADDVRPESVITVTGEVVAREPATVNPRLATGEVELRVRELVVQSKADVLPFQVAADDDAPEEMRLRYRFLDLRRERLQRNMILRAQIIHDIRERMITAGFNEFQTPILTSSSPEGARDFLVPARLHPGKFYALPQAPQQFKQLTMVAGFDRYFQIAPCFRDEAGRADRTLMFYQLDVEMSFVTQDDVFTTMEPVIRGTFERFAGNRAMDAGPWRHIPYAQAMLDYGSDKPDLRNPLIIRDVTKQFAGSGFGLFAKIAASGGVVRAIPAPGAGGKPRGFFDKLNEWARAQGAGGLGYIAFDADGPKGPIAKNLEPERVEAIRSACGIGPGDAVFFAAGKVDEAAKFAGTVRTRIGQELELIEKDVFRFCWIVDFPMFELNEETGKVDFSHNPFSMPQGEMEALENQDPLTIPAYQYDIVCNGYEMASGAIRNHKAEIMVKAFGMAGYPESAVEERFGGMLNAFRYGAPPHGGMAAGIDRIVMLLAEEPNLREVNMYPMNQQGEDLMMGAPSTVEPGRWKELHIKPDLPPAKDAAKDGAAKGNKDDAKGASQAKTA
ncbi:aspartate--tRNA ligase [Roseomonas indoligenes]|uniref:Aspartate--tRNA(Asp/Asn) ligase n=1 Tax=Roseomonas indoligenes TaxID=2820811 RepID=A0A940MY18_9PROT|nr:aspartate--tRNA ligase [Pararoseomonas indoligenes]MBP0494211.1 aspartate--tRNA ligase [Pararoseomonas indoligenes]